MIFCVEFRCNQFFYLYGVFSFVDYKLEKIYRLPYIYPFLSHSLKAQNVMKNVGCLEFSFYNLPRGNSVYYKSRGGEWAV